MNPSSADPRQPVRMCEDPAEYVAAAGAWRPWLPFPVLQGPVLNRYAALFEPGNLPAVAAAPRPGVVISTGGEFSRAAARLLARATSRPCRHVAADQLLAAVTSAADQLTAVVALSGELSAVGDWPGRAGHRVGVVTGRSEQALACLIYRSLTVGTAAEDNRVFTVSHPLLDGAMEADAVYLSDVDYVRERTARLVVLRGQGRECCVSLLDGVICGRSVPLGAVPATTGPGTTGPGTTGPSTTGPESAALEALDPIPVPGLRSTPCLTGEGCFRTDLAADEILPAAGIRGTVIFSQSCSAIAIGTNAYPQAISLTLALLEGTAVAIVGVLGVHVVHPSAQWDLQDALAEGLPLGDVTARLAERGRPQRGELNRFGLLGDPALTLPVGSAMTGSGSKRPDLDLAAQSAFTRLDHVITRLQRLQWLEIDVDDQELAALRGRLRQAARDLFHPQAGERAARLADDLAEFQHQVVAALIVKIHGPGWDPSWRSAGFTQVSSQDATCPGCERPIAVRLLLRHRVDQELHLQTLQCRRCGDAWWSSEPGERTVELRGPIDLECSRDDDVFFGRELVNHGPATIRGGIGYAFRRRKNLGLPPGSSQAVVLGPGETTEFRARIELTGTRPPADTHSMLAVGLFDGIFVSTMSMLHMA